MIKRTSTKLRLLSATFLAGVVTTPVQAQTQQPPATETPADDAQGGNEIIVTGSRRAVSLQDVPINISAIDSATLQANRLDDIGDIGLYTPGLTVPETGPRTANSIVMRGITSGGPGGSNRSTAVGVYLGDIPLYVDFKFLDINRVETLLGPQGTLYGLGTLAGAIRYIPNRPNFGKFELEAHTRVYDVAHSDGVGNVFDATINLPIVRDKVALRVTAGNYIDPGFIDSPFLVQQLGVSLPQPDFNNPAAVAANLRRGKDLNDEQTYAVRAQLGFDFGWLRPTFSYIRQDTRTHGTQTNGGYGATYTLNPKGVPFPDGRCVYTGCRGVLGTGKYENGARVEQPAHRTLDLFAAEIEMDLGDIAQLVSATAYSRQKLHSQGDIADLLLDLDYDYELFPAFAGTTTSDSKPKQFNQEVRLTSAHGGAINWNLGGFYNHYKSYTFSAERIPGFPEFGRANSTGRGSLYGTLYQGLVRPDGLEYISFTDTYTKEYAAFAEATWQITSKLQVTGGIRYYKYKSYISGATDTPLLSGGRRRTPYPLIQFDPSRIRTGSTKDDGLVYKANASYTFSPDLMLYGTYSTGYRIGGVNRVAPCIIPLPAGQNVCALPSELSYGPDKTTNYELGVRFSLFHRMLQGTVDVYNIDWTNLQLGSQTANGAVGITANAGGARSRGVEGSLSLNLGRFNLSGNYTYLDAKLTQDAPGLIGGISKAFNIPGAGDAFDGDRLPGSSKHAGSITATYTVPMANDADLDLAWSTAARSNTYSTTGLRGYGEAIPGYSTSRTSITYKTKAWEASLFANNVFDKYAVASVSNDYTLARANDGVLIRSYGFGVIQPRTIGVEMRFHY
ncbi:MULTISPECIES: TonB-dependent receptor [unclassified Sphingomonas]|uniref:TonB-dependent receptor n=1 Tax=unclassified Sphingomonas TaxID=196159 RepID=UPI0025D96FA2|nr:MULTISPECIES: TonB-dependent receptor [unclassified Sphingomonas]